jgi:hypothetical protein
MSVASHRNTVTYDHEIVEKVKSKEKNLEDVKSAGSLGSPMMKKQNSILSSINRMNSKALSP